jgi:CDP-glucose 4,6-dehydratase
MDRQFWNKKRVLVTGHTGFKGSWLSLWLQKAGSHVTGYALEPPTTPNLFTEAGVARGMTSITGDLRDYESLKNVIRDVDPEIILHLAAQSVVRYSYENPIETYAVNVMGTVHLFDAVRVLGKPRVVVNVTSDKCYDNREWLWGYREVDPMGGHDPYSNSKGCAELVTSAYQQSYFPGHRFETHGVAIASVRAGNVIGGGDWTRDQLLPDIIRSFTRKEPVLIRSPKAIRPWQFVLEPLNGYLMVAEHLASNPRGTIGAWNFGPEDIDARPVEWIVERMVQQWKDGVSWRKDEGQHPHEAHYLKLDSTKARTLLGWSPRLPLASALEWVVEWYKEFYAGGDIRALTLSHIDRFEQRGVL